MPLFTSNRKHRALISQIKRSIIRRGLFLQTQRDVERRPAARAIAALTTRPLELKLGSGLGNDSNVVLITPLAQCSFSCVLLKGIPLFKHTAVVE